MATIFDVAGYILAKQGEMSSMKLQKLCYYAQAWSLVWDDKELFPEDFQAWTNGPVCTLLYDAHKGKFNISNKDIPVYNDLSSEQIQSIDAVLKHYSDKDPQWLCTLTHMERPWNDARKCYANGDNCEEIITKPSMKEYYGSL
jgi:uncharacterized phage-associated protein